MFISELYTNDSIPRSAVQTIVEKMSSIFDSHFINNLQSSVILALEKCNCDLTTIDSIKESFTVLRKPLVELSTEYKRFTYLKKSGYFIPPEEVTFGTENTLKTSNSNEAIIQTNVSKSCFVPLRHTLKKLFEMENVYNMTCKYVQSLENQKLTIENFVQSSLAVKKTVIR